MRESSVERRCKAITEQAGGLLVKLQHSVVGLPDRLVILPGRPMRLVEFKKPGTGFASNIQAFWHRRLGVMDHPVEVVDSVDGFRQVFQLGKYAWRRSG